MKASANLIYFSPGACSQVTLTALEHVGIPFEAKLIAFMRGDHRSNEFLAINSKGKVPTLVFEGRVLTENAAILSYLAEKYPSAGLSLPINNPYERAKFIADLCYFSSGLHPIVTRIRIPGNFSEPASVESVWRMAVAAMIENLRAIELRLVDRDWWAGGEWTIIDAYLAWVWFRVTGAGLDPTPFPNIGAHAMRHGERSAVMRVVERESEATRYLVAQGLEVRFQRMPWLE